jgi:hypothetical protein
MASGRSSVGCTWPDLRFSADQLNFLLAREMDLATRICQDSNSLVHAVRDVVFVWPIY